ncbi:MULTISPECIES: hypothetical protein [unclassified Pseudomonas]|uniref:hypothetical protein n=1 Tax=unclassified Pseudomonas TaxID=196821 RepID=UPI000D376743|nr:MULTISPECIES: hypothetical protein [unclassified Pseudomonas]RAU43682.1 hypothetical protein DBP26_019330 [Pseudomonas sp. RIT 409]RAU54386.1 hypothetical protein DBY65_008640 [Pseudomonas sp. RIT 412]
MSWIQIIAGDQAIEALTDEQKIKAVSAAEQNISCLAEGISGLGSIMGAAGAGKFGIDEQAVARVGWMLESLGSLIGNLVEFQDAIHHYQREQKPRKGGAK